MMPTPFHDQLSAYLDGELDDAEAARLEAELRVNPTLRAELDELRDVADFVRSTGRRAAPKGLHDRVMAAVAAETPPTPWWAWLRRPFGIPLEGVAVALAAAVVLLLALPEPSIPTGDAIPTEDAAEPVASTPLPEDPPIEQHVDPATNADDGVAIVDEDRDEPAARPPIQRKGDLLPRPTGTRVAKGAPPEAQAVGSGGSVGAKGEATAGEGTAEPVPVEAAPAKTEVAKAPSTLPTHRYKVYAESASVLAALQRTAARHQGVVRDEAGATVRTGTQSAEMATYLIRIPASALQDFHRDLQKLGVRVVQDDARSGDFAEIVDVAVTIVMIGPARVDAAPIE